MAARTSVSTRWLTLIMVAALACSVAVVWGLIQITGESPASSSTPGSDSAAPAGSAAPPGSAALSGSASGPPSGSAAAAGSATGSRSSPPRESGAEESLSSTSAVPPFPTPATLLPGTGLPLPAAWTGTAEMTITVLGRCATTGGTSSYTRPADLAIQGPVVGSGPINDPNRFSMTLGITPADIPGLSIYSASTDQYGEVRRTWWMTSGTGVGPRGEHRTLLSGVLVDDQPVHGVLPPNLLVDNETDLQPCDNGGTVRVPRTLAAGSRLTGWVTPTRAHLDIRARTVDGERAVAAVCEFTRRAGT